MEKHLVSNLESVVPWQQRGLFSEVSGQPQPQKSFPVVPCLLLSPHLPGLASDPFIPFIVIEEDVSLTPFYKNNVSLATEPINLPNDVDAVFLGLSEVGKSARG